MDVKKWLSRGWKIQREIAALVEARQKAFYLACASGIYGDGVKVQTSQENRTEQRLLSLAEYDRHLIERVNQLYRVLEEIGQTIEKVTDGALRILLIERYINYKTWEQIAEVMGYKDVRHIYRLHKRALIAAEKALHKKIS